MKINHLRPTKLTNLDELSVLIRQYGARRTALPSALSDPMLLSIARDLRTLDRPGKERENSSDSLASPLLLVMCLIYDNTQQDLVSGELVMSETELINAFRIYQLAIEREIVARITGIGIGDEDERLQYALNKIHEECE